MQPQASHPRRREPYSRWGLAASGLLIIVVVIIALWPAQQAPPQVSPQLSKNEVRSIRKAISRHTWAVAVNLAKGPEYRLAFDAIRRGMLRKVRSFKAVGDNLSPVNFVDGSDPRLKGIYQLKRQTNGWTVLSEMQQR